MSTDDRPRVYRGAVAIGRLVGAAAASAFRRHGFGHGEIAAAWTEIVGTELARVSRPERLAWPRDGAATARGAAGGATLTVAVEGPRAIELQHAAPRIIEAINTLYGYRAIGRMRLVQAPAGPHRRHGAKRRPLQAAGDGPEAIRSPALRGALARLDAATAEH